MLPCVCRLQPVLALLFFTLFTQGENCPATCLCPDPHTVDCSGRGLTRLPDEIPLDVRRLLLADNWIPRIPSDFLVLYSDLVYLDLRNNSLSHIEPDAFIGLTSLRELELERNALSGLQVGAL
uniref:LRRNT domain-containing protein n=1 Tax=Cyprinus carpio TaxID=7962 RepID=A0A8C2FD09_CYPCA